MLQEIIDILFQSIKEPFGYFLSPKKRLYILYLSTSLVLALYVYFKKRTQVSFLRYIFPKKIWLNQSAQVDYSLFIINGFFKVIILAPIVILGIYLQEWVSELLFNVFGTPNIELSRSSIVITYTIVLWLFGDFAHFYLHYLMHKIPLLWKFHKIHHSATVLNPITQYRIHPLELVLNNLKSIIVFGVVTGLFYYLTNGKIGIIAFLGVNVFKFVFLTIGSNLRHSHVKFTFPLWLEYIFISPFQHQIHHSDKQEHYDKNIGSHLAIWDWLFGSLIVSKKVKNLRFGLGRKEGEKHKSILDNLTTPFRK